MKALVTGADGFVGRWLVKALLDQGMDVVALTRRSREPVSSRVQNIQADLLDCATLQQTLDMLKDVDYVFHLAALLPSNEISLEDYKTANVQATEVILAWAKRQSVRSFVFMSTVAVIGAPLEVPITESHPVDPQIDYARSKLDAEKVVEAYRASGFACMSMRLTSPYGAGMKSSSVLPLFVSKAAAGQIINWHGSGSRAQDFIDVRDVAALCIAASRLPYEQMPSVLNLGSGRATSMKQLAEAVKLHYPQVEIGSSGKDDPQEGVVWEMDMSEAYFLFPGFQHTDFGDGLRHYIKTLPSQGPVWWND